jgi:hypothetical protein
MSRTVRCPACLEPCPTSGRDEGEPIRCNDCGREFYPPGEVPTARPVDSDRPHATPSLALPSGLDADQRSGLRVASMLQFVAHLLTLLVWLLLLSLMLDLLSDAPRGPGRANDGPVILSVFIPLLLVASLLLSLLAAGAWTQAPARNAARGLGVAVMALTGIEFFVVVVFHTSLILPKELLGGPDGGFGRADSERFVLSLFFCEWARQVTLAWMLFAVSTTVRHPASPRMASSLLGVAFCLLPVFLWGWTYLMKNADGDARSRELMMMGGNLLLVCFLLGWASVAALRLYVALGRPPRAQNDFRL